MGSTINSSWCASSKSLLWSPDLLTTRHQIKCPIHNFIRVTRLATLVIDHPYMQRTRNIKQLGLAHYTYPSAVHTRFTHMLGTYYLAGLMAEEVQRTRRKFVIPGISSIPTELTSELIECIKLAGLCHDLGHGPYSHVLDSLFNNCDQRLRQHPMREHEARSVALTREILSPLIPDPYVNFVLDLIHPSAEVVTQVEAAQSQALYQIVSNYKNGIDVDKFDYLLRDSHALGLGLSFSYQRLLNSLRISSVGDITYHRKCAEDVYELFQSRYTMHVKAYSHRKSKKIETMILDLLLMMDEKLRFIESLDDMKRFVAFTDSTLFDLTRVLGDENSQQLLRRIESCQYYDIVLETQELEEAKENMEVWCQDYEKSLFKLVPVTCSFAADYSQIKFHDEKCEELELKPDRSLVTTRRYLVVCRDQELARKIKRLRK